MLYNQGKKISKIHAGSLIKDVYYKYHYQPFAQPVLTENGTVGGDSFAVASDSYLAQAGLPAYAVFDGTGNGWHSGNGHPHWLAFYNPNPLKLSKLWIRNRGGGSAGGAFIKDWQLQYSDNGSDWAVITTGTSANTDNAYWSIQMPEGYNQYHHYYRLYVTSGAGYNSGYTVIVEMAIEAEERVAVKSDLSDYDYFLRESDGRINTIYRGSQMIWYDKNLYRDVMVNPNMTSATAPSGLIIANVNRYASGGVIQCWGDDNQKEGDYGTRVSSTQYVFPDNAQPQADGYYYVSCEILSQTNIEMQNVYARIYYPDNTYEQFAIAAVTPRDNNFHSYATPLFKLTKGPVKSLMIGWHGVMYNPSYYCYQYIRNCRLMKRNYRFEE